MKSAENGTAAQVSRGGGTVTETTIAGAGFEPTTFGL